MRWLIWPRQYGKTRRIEDWWLEDPENRVILCSSESAASYRRGVLLKRLQGNPVEGIRFTRRFMEARVMSWRTWQNEHQERGRRRLEGIEVAIDEISPMLAEMLHADIKIIAGAGRVEEPDPDRKAMADEAHKRSAYMFPPGIDGSVM